MIFLIGLDVPIELDCRAEAVSLAAVPIFTTSPPLPGSMTIWSEYHQTNRVIRLFAISACTGKHPVDVLTLVSCTPYVLYAWLWGVTGIRQAGFCSSLAFFAESPLEGGHWFTSDQRRMNAI